MPDNKKDKERTMRKRIDAVEEIISTYEYSHLGVKRVAHIAGVTKNVFAYFDIA
jgi:AcrR family transcriptional regulator